MVVLNSKNLSENNLEKNNTSNNMGDDRNALFDEIRNFRQKGLKPVEIKVVNGSGEQITEKRGAKGLQVCNNLGVKGPGYVVDTKPDLQVGMIIPGLMIGLFCSGNIPV